MSEQKSDQEKTEEPTAYKLEQAKKDGNVSVSKEVSSVMLMGAAMMVFVATGKVFFDQLQTLFEFFMSGSGVGFKDAADATGYLKHALFSGMKMMGPLLVILLVMSIGVNVIQTGGVISAKAMEPKGSKMNPINGIKKIFSMKGFVELAKGILKLGIILVVAYFTVRSEINNFVSFIIAPLSHSMSEAGGYVLLFITRVLVALLLLSIADALFQRYDWKKELKMTKQEVKDEYKQMEGDPHVKGQRRQFGIKLRQQKRMDHAVLNSDVVVTNPTHYAVALRYDPDNNEAPMVMVKGQRLRALRIKELAKHYGIPIVENKPVARALFATAEEDQYIPADLYRAVAEILAYVYKLKHKNIG